MTNYKQTYVWGEALKLARRLFSLSEDLPENEWAMATALRELATTVPGDVAVDLVKHSDPRPETVLRAAALIDLVDQIYPALDTSGATKSVELLLERMQSRELFSELRPAA